MMPDGVGMRTVVVVPVTEQDKQAAGVVGSALVLLVSLVVVGYAVVVAWPWVLVAVGVLGGWVLVKRVVRRS